MKPDTGLGRGGLAVQDEPLIPSGLENRACYRAAFRGVLEPVRRRAGRFGL
jgi:hypothetical protein